LKIILKKRLRNVEKKKILEFTTYYNPNPFLEKISVQLLLIRISFEKISIKEN